MDKATLAKYIDHTLLKADATEEQIRKLCFEAAEYKFASVCVNPTWVPLCAELLKGTGVKVCTVIGFPLGATPSDVKAYETKVAVEQGAEEVDMVINIGMVKAKKYDDVEKDVKAVVDASGKALTKVIIECCYLTNEEKVEVCKRCVAAGAEYVKTSTGFGTHGATPEDVKLMKETVGDKALVKAAGGIRTFDDAMKMINNGASRIGASAGIAILNGIH
ncbi:deoxyribose-phosphate aldolase, putative [Entamoeba dispar SAW760]|uniref:deoxyribose-phosphate aldolase n=1 Tax=Entamoeba dispar (strain ATCC PRA-260 / SAW760) TaxID=370354 RepID=B0EKN5_ENTDS|nr:deoxyribose-phosphate aldolase, putative [Entamoeba dispar SAW760]EDR24912.1 deoxyribose-phosphate aldolase, putative [Entamoeba dispar SAW760]|eukprot:EDR24912.1 deoxyribose-phosphate aldolase, putative [Entamoeba dispar SAW760]